jgi:Uma2 family endonuclease
MPPEPNRELPAVDERLVAPQTRYEIEDGRIVYVPPTDKPHGEAHARLADVVRAHRHAAYEVAVDMLTRTSRIDDIAPDVSIYRSAPDPRTGGRQLEELAFEVASTESLGHAGARAVKLIGRGVRRVFAIDVARGQVLEWSTTLDAWSFLDRSFEIDDPVLAAPVPVGALLDAVAADGAVARAYRLRRHPEFLAEREEGREEGRVAGLAQAVLAVLVSRGLEPTADEHTQILGERDANRVDRWLADVASCTSVADLLGR